MNLAQLRTKIRECFNITPEKVFNLTYIDEDGDTVLLGDDADLHDAAIKQGLNPLRIDNKLKHNSSPPQNTFSKINSDPIRAVMMSTVNDAAIKQGLNPLRIDIKLKHNSSPPQNPLSKINSDPTRAAMMSTVNDTNQKRKITSVQESSTPCDQQLPGKFPRQAQVEPTLMHAQPNWGSGLGPRQQMLLRNSFVGGQLSPATLPIMGGQVEPMFVGHSSKPNGDKCEVCGANLTVRCYKIKGKYDVCSFCYNRMVACCEGFTTPSFNSKIKSNPFASYDLVMPKDQIYFSRTYARYRGVLFGTQDCRVQDITIPVGTRLAPNTPFKKIWRVICTRRLPYGTRLVKLCGTYGFSTPWDVALEIPRPVLPVQESIDVSLDLKAPSFPGKYFAWYSLADSSEFGEPFLVAVHVVANLSASQNATINNVTTESLSSNAATKNHAINVKPTTDTKNNKVINKPEEPVSSHPAGNSGKQVVVIEEGDDGLEKTVEKLVEMGYIDKDLNRKVLRTNNNYDLGLAIDALECIHKDSPKDD
ncbi:NBR1 [Rhynchospora pubera]|uniref:NBR1 n=1 Tax=Rhynchospora pubera TaxID=906938 RepID=A0AAV8FNN1_9POAL|nr:NBR1 [Rhynchospora pubera]